MFSRAQEVEPLRSFPSDWEGQWQGTLHIFKAGADTAQQVAMALRLFPLDSTGHWQWHIIYGSGKARTVREYELVVQDSLKGHYLIDEKNGILLDSYLLGNSFCSLFEVGSSSLLVTYRLEGETLIFEVVAGKSEPLRQSGGEGDIPPVQSYELSVKQCARLQRVP
ncbi:MAG: hypothetical protein D6730_17060 [Bacteroidetes bacterium]|nr:MAG: hypothetical protein D6730_17060 [Bacteroidota bacterium]